MEETFIKKPEYNQNQTTFFGIPNAIITEYFSFRENVRAQKSKKYQIQPFDLSLLEHESKEDTTVSKKVIERDVRDIFILPIAEYLANEENVFPEDYLFQVVHDGPISDVGKTVERLRQEFRRYIEIPEKKRTFQHEIHLINFFRNKDK